MITRRLENQVLNALKRSPAVVLTGPRQIGKTTLAYSISEHLDAVYLDLEKSIDIQKIADIATFYAENKDKLIILDEVHRTPNIFNAIRGIIDEERRKGHRVGLFLFLGSASLDLLQQSSESLAGRLAYIELHPLDVLELEATSTEKLNTAWLRGGFPESLLAESDSASLAWRLDFVRSYLERDIPLLGPRIPAQTLERLWTMMAHSQGSTFNTAKLASSLDTSATTIRRYLDLMIDLLLVRPLHPWTANIKKRIVKSPKVYLRDSGIAHALLHIADFNSLLGHPVAGGSWEAFVIENIMSVTPYGLQPYFYRSQAGAELDLILEISPRERWAIEIKRSSVPSIGKGFHIAADDVGAKRKFVVYAGQDQFSMGSNTQAVSLKWMMEEILQL